MNAYLRSVDARSNRFRWYSVRTQDCLFGGVDVVLSWGRIGHKGGTSRIVHTRGAGDALSQAHRVLKVRIRHGYQLVAAG